MSGFGTEIAFRLGPGTIEEARAISSRLATAAAGCRRHVLFVDAAAGEYGVLAEWDRREEAEGLERRPAIRAELAALCERSGRPARVRVYEMEEDSAVSS